jgi:DNA-binding MarR family transcriptional regulator
VSNDNDFESLKKEVRELKQTVYSLKNTIIELTNQLESSGVNVPLENGQYSIFDNKSNTLEGDVSWNRLLNLLSNADRGLTTTELARRWGKSRTRTSEVLNKLAEDGQIFKYRDGRRIRFRSSEE